LAYKFFHFLCWLLHNRHRKSHFLSQTFHQLRLAPKTLKLKTKQQELLTHNATPILIYVLAFITRLFIGNMLYPIPMLTVVIIHSLFHFLCLFVFIYKVCILTTPFFASNTTLVAYFFAKEVWDLGTDIANTTNIIRTLLHLH